MTSLLSVLAQRAGAVPSEALQRGSSRSDPREERRGGEGRGGSSTQVFCDARAGVSHRGLIAGKVCQERRELGLREMQGTLN